jgi:hypothetical protein
VKANRFDVLSADAQAGHFRIAAAGWRVGVIGDMARRGTFVPILPLCPTALDDIPARPAERPVAGCEMISIREIAIRLFR